MTLPPNCLPAENPALSGDLLAVIGQPAPADGQPAAPFAEIMAVACPPSVTCTSQAPAPAPVPAPVMYSSHCYTTLLQPATLEDPSVQIEKPAAEVPSPDAEPATEDEGAMLLAYQLIAGQWVPQPVVAPAATPVAGADGSISSEAIQNKHSESAGSAFFAQHDSRHPADIDHENAERSPASFIATQPQPADKVAAPSAEKSVAIPVAPSQSAAPGVAETKILSPADKPGAEPAPIANPAVSVAFASAATVNNPAALAQGSQLANSSPVKFAAPGSKVRTENASGVNSLNSDKEKKTLVYDIKNVRPSGRQVGTSAANREFSMPYSAVNKSSAPATTALPQAVFSGGMQTGATNAAAESSAAVAVQAPRLVQEIHAIADRISTIDRNTVEVRFDFNESDRLSVRVEYRDGTVHTTFRTDSDSLRAAVAREWSSQAPAAESRAYRVAEPVFTANTSGPSGDLSQSGHGSGESNGRAFEQQVAPGLPGFGHNGRSAHTSTGSSSAPSASARPETSHHLHTFA